MGIASYGSVLLSRGWLITVEAPGHPRHPPSMQLFNVVKRNLTKLTTKRGWFSVRLGPQMEQFAVSGSFICAQAHVGHVVSV